MGRRDPRGGMPSLVRPMLATLGTVPTGDGWAYEFKWDGVRAVSYSAAGRTRLTSRNDRDVTESYPELSALATALGERRAVLDGEIVALDADGAPSFALLQWRMHVRKPSADLLARVPVRYYAFDVLWLDGRSTMDEPYTRRRELLSELAIDDPLVATPPHFGGPGEDVLAAARANGLEGVVAKRLTSSYRPGIRSKEWVKTPLGRTQEVVIGGWQPGQGNRAGTIGSLLLGVYDDTGALQYVGKVGTGFTREMLRDLERRFAKLARARSPFAVPVPKEFARDAHWVKPALVGEVEFRTWSPDGRLRHPAWRGLRPDKEPPEVRRV